MRRRRRSSTGFVVLALLLAAACGGTAPEPSSRPLKILVSNDDGIDGPGILALADALLPLGTVTVAAPRDPRSGTSHGVTSDRLIAVEESERQGTTWFSIDALPATCVRLALEALLPEKPDVVVSGINRGENLGTVTFYSATVAGAREAAFLGIPSIAVNLAAGKGMDYKVAAGIMADIVRAVGKDGIPKGTFLNVNIPALSLDKIKGVRITKQDTRAPIEFFEKTVTLEGATEYKPSWKHHEPAGEDTDIWAVRNGYVSVSVFGIAQSAAVSAAARKSLERLEKLTWK
ncbi:MAG: 5'/3'-nucleotidase SurE [Candidatus Aminicenantes bacterium RBG_16_63_16]|nr:MAG: 5'/3'-nucleotidase SurE [Candidatus Aminicenantes bacterium RBG_16_63_16]